MGDRHGHNWVQRLLGGTAGRLFARLVHGERTVAELREGLDLTGNAVRAQLNRLEREGLVEQAGQRGGVRKPHLLYRLSPQGERLLPKAYLPVLCHLLEVLARERSPREMEQLLEKVADRIAPHEPMAGDDEQRLARAMTLLAELGGVAELQRDGRGRPVIQGQSCPLSGAVGDHPRLCHMVEGVLSRIVGRPVHEQCDRGARPACRFVVEEGRSG